MESEKKKDDFDVVYKKYKLLKYVKGMVEYVKSLSPAEIDKVTNICHKCCQIKDIEMLGEAYQYHATEQRIISGQLYHAEPCIWDDLDWEDMFMQDSSDWEEMFDYINPEWDELLNFDEEKNDDDDMNDLKI